MRDRMSYRVLPYLDDFLIAPTPVGTVAGEEDYWRSDKRLGALVKRLVIVQHPDKIIWGGAGKVYHQGVHVDTEAMCVFVTESKFARMRRLGASCY